MAAMTRKDILQILLLQAKANGFQFRRWYRKNLDAPWEDFDAAIATLTRAKRYYALLFSHDFASTFWKPGAQISFIVPTSTYTRKNKAGEVITVTRKAFTRRTLKVDSWRYHLREMAVTEEPLRYIQRFIIRKEDLERYRAEHPDSSDLMFLEDAIPPSKMH
jgi:hypothetical protein